MPTPSEALRSTERGVRHESPRSVFSNFRPGTDCGQPDQEMAPVPELKTSPQSQSAIRHLQSEIDQAFARSFIYRFLAQAFEYPTDAGWSWFGEPEVRTAFQSAVNALSKSGNGLRTQAAHLMTELRTDAFGSCLQDYIAVFGHAARGSCPLNEIEYGDLKADPLFQPHRLADLAAFYRAFGLEVAEEATERPDHICVELELMSVLSVKEAYALEHQLDDAELLVCRDAQKSFLREHLGRWTPAFTRRLAQAAGNGVLGSLAKFTEEFIGHECHHFGIAFGSEDLMLRPVDEGDESVCTTCGIRNLPPGAMTAT